MHLTLIDSKYLKDSISIISELVNEAKFSFKKDGVELIAMDPANVAMVVFKLLSSCFAEYKLLKEVELVINLSNLKQVLRRARTNDVVVLETEDNKLKIQLKSNTIRTFTIPILDSAEAVQKIPELNFPIIIELNSTILNNAIEDVDIVAESVNFVSEKDKFLILAEGELSRVDIEIGLNEAKIKNNGENVRAKYSVEYLKKMMDASKLSEKVIIQFNNDYPLKLDYKTVDKVMLSFILAPRVENY